MAVAEDFGFGIDLKETMLRCGQGERAPPECRSHGHDMAVLQKGMRLEFRHGRRHFNNVSEPGRSGNRSASQVAFSKARVWRMVNSALGKCVLVHGHRVRE